MNRRLAVRAAFLAGLAGLLVLAARTLFERVEETVDRGFSGEAAIHDFYALKELFSSMGIEARAVADLRRMPPTDHVLWIATSIRGSQSRRLVEWASAGGHLVVLPAGPIGEDPLLQALGVQRFPEAEADEDDHLSQPTFPSERPPWPLLYPLEGSEVLRSEGAPDAAWMLSVRIGEGAASVLSDRAFLHNEAIGRMDHALIAWRAAVLDQEPAGLWLVYRDPRPSVWVLMSARARPVAISLAVLILASLLFFSRRFGPRLAPAPRERRQLAEHVRATGDYLWDVGCEDTLLDAQRQAVASRLGLGDRRRAGPELKKAALRAATSVGLDEKSARRTVTLKTTRDRREFTRIIHFLEGLRRSS